MFYGININCIRICLCKISPSGVFPFSHNNNNNENENDNKTNNIQKYDMHCLISIFSQPASNSGWG